MKKGVVINNRLLAVVLLFLMMASIALAENGLSSESLASFVKIAAEHGDEDAQFNLGLMYDKGEGVPQDCAEAVKWYTKAARQGNASAQFNLGLMYDKGEEGVPQNYAAAVKWYAKAAEKGIAGAQFNLGLMYYTGRGVPQDKISAYALWDIAVAKGLVEAKKIKDKIIEKMTPEQLAEGQKLSKELFERYGNK